MAEDLFDAIEACKHKMVCSLDAFQEHVDSIFQTRQDSCPQFSDGDPVDWLHKLQLYFSHNNVRPADFMIYAALNLNRPASIWYRAILNNQPALTFPLFVDAIVKEYSPSTIVPTFISTFKNKYEDTFEKQYVLKPWPMIAPTEGTTSLPSTTTRPISNFEQEQNEGNDPTRVIAITDSLLLSTTLMTKNDIEIVPEKLNKFSAFLGIPHHYFIDQDTVMRQNYLAVNKLLPLLTRQLHEQELFNEGMVKPLPTSSIILVFDPGGHSIKI